MTPATPSRSVVARVATPALSLQLGWVRVEGLWREPRRILARWASRRTAQARWGPVAPAQRRIWADKDL